MNSITSLYMHVPFCLHLCNYCDFYKLEYNQQKKQFTAYHDYLLSTAKTQRALFDQHGLKFGELETLYLGGGTPSLWGVEGAAFFKKELLGKYFSLSKDLEFTMEFDPGSWDEETYYAWKDLGLNRISVGTQAFSDEFISILDRGHDLAETKKTLAFFQKEKENFSVDLLLGVPYSETKKRNLKNEIDELLSYEPNHLSLYILKTRSNYPLKAYLPEDEYVRDEYLFVCEYLASQGLNQYEVSNFAKDGFESAHNLRYWDQTSVAALGPNATGFLKNGETCLRYQWAPASGKMQTEELSEENLRLEEVYLALRTSKPLKLEHFWDKEELLKANELLGKWISRGLFCSAQECLTPPGLLILDSLMDELFQRNLL